MKKIDIRKVIQSKSEDFFEKNPKFVSKLTVVFLEKLLHIREINDFISKYNNESNFEFIDALFNYLDFSYYLSAKDKIKIPSSGRLIIISNHPLGGLDGLALLRAVSEARNDVKIVANDILMNVENLTDLFLPYDLFKLSSQRTQIKNIEDSINREEAVVFFPAAEVSRFTMKGIKDRRWRNGALKFSKKMDCPVLPVHIKGRNSLMFYLVSTLKNSLAMFMLPGELFKQKKKKITFKVGDVIPFSVLKSDAIKLKVQNNLLKKHIYRIGKNKSPIFKTEETIINAVDSREVKKEISRARLLGHTKDNKKIFLVDYEQSPNLMKEIARLREITFRKVGEGTGKSHDLDMFDPHYKHLTLWNDESLDIVGSYRLGVAKEILESKGSKGIYSNGLFHLSDSFKEILEQSLELGRSFVQQKFWRSNALDYLWQGVAAFLSDKPDIKYLFGAVSISDSYPDVAKALIISYYMKWYGLNRNYVKARYPYKISIKDKEEADKILSGKDYLDDFKNLKRALLDYGLSVPVLFRKYTSLCEYGGSKFLDFSNNGKFSSVDGLILLDLSKLMQDKRERYYSRKSFKEQERQQ